MTYGEHPFATHLADLRRITATEVIRLNGAIPLPASVPEPGAFCELDGRNCTPFCTCKGGHSPVNVDEDWLPASCAIPFGIGDLEVTNIDPEPLAPQDLESYCLGDFHRVADWMKKAWINE